MNDAPTISNIADRTIDGNTSTGSVSFTIGDDDLATVALSASSSNTTLVPTANIVFGGSGATRTVTVTPASNQNGTATITVTVTDSGGLTARDSFVLTVRPAGYTFVGVQNVPPAGRQDVQGRQRCADEVAIQERRDGREQLAGRAHRDGARPASLRPDPHHHATPIPEAARSGTTPTTKTWQFNLQTKEANGQSYPVGLYEVTITPTTPGFLPSPTFQMQLVK